MYLNSQLLNTEAFGEIGDNLEHFCMKRRDLLRCRYLYNYSMPLPPPPADGAAQLVDVAHNRAQVLTRLGIYIGDNRSGPRYSANVSRFLLGASIFDSYLGYKWNETLTHLDLAIQSDLGLLSILPYLAKYNRLTHIRLTERKTGLPPASVFFSGLNRQNYLTKLGPPNRTQMPSVRQLNLFQFDINPSTGIFLYLSVIFPHISALHLEDCPMSNSPGKHTFPVWFFNSLQRFAQLSQLYHNHRLVLELETADEKRDELIQLIGEQMLGKDRI